MINFRMFYHFSKKLYTTTGGSEDWSYAFSWDWNRGGASAECVTDTYGGFDNTLLQINSETIRYPWYLIETASNKHPPEDSLGELDGIKEQGMRFSEIKSIQGVRKMDIFLEI